MPIYEFYCGKCNTLFSFFSRSVNTTKVPGCPKCGRKLERKMSLFAKVRRGGGEEPAEDGMPPVDEAKMEKAMAMLAGEAEKLNEDDPRQAAQLMRKLTDATGMNLGAGMEEALQPPGKGGGPRSDRGGNGRSPGRGRTLRHGGEGTKGTQETETPRRRNPLRPVEALP